jgi:hypothetical protein
MNPDQIEGLPEERYDGPWPRVYRPSRKQRLLMEVIGALCIAGGLAALVAALLWRPGKNGAVLIVMMAACGLCFLLAGIYTIPWIRGKRILLFEDAIEFVDLGYGRRRLSRDEILGLRVIQLQYGFMNVFFELREPGRKPLKTDLYCERDAVLDAWLAAIPNLDVRDRERAEEELLQRTELGRTEEERRRSLATAQSIARAAAFVAVATAAWGMLYPRPYEAVIVALFALPLATAALLLGGRGRYSVAGERNEVRPSLLAPLFVPGMVLLLRALADVHAVDWRLPLFWAALGAVPLTALVVIGDPTLGRRWFGPLIVFLLLSAHPWGTVQMANAHLDRSEPERFRVAVLDKHVTSGNRGTTLELRLAAWGPVPADLVLVSREVYRAVEVGGTVCVALRPGALGVRWFLVQVCDESEEQLASRRTEGAAQADAAPRETNPGPLQGVSSFHVYRSDDQGLSWGLVGRGLPSSARINALAIDGTTAYAGSEDGLFISKDGGQSWVERAISPASPVQSFAVAGHRVFGGTKRAGVFVTEDAGASWRQVSRGLSNLNVRSLAARGGVVYAGADAEGVFVLPEGAEAWAPFGRDLPGGSQVFDLAIKDAWVYAALYSKGLYRLQGGGGSWQSVGDVRPLRFVVHGESLLAGHNPGGVYRSIDEGRTWHLAGGLTERSPTWVLGGAGSNVLVGTSPEGVAISHDAGASWQQSAKGLPPGAAVVALASDKACVLAGVVTQDGR